ncbi:MAG TPA: SPFH domain-containing protein [Phycisphaerae bacterium]
MAGPHDHHHHDEHDPHAHRALHVLDAPFDPAQQSLADALRAAFRVLKIFMVLLLVIYLFSGIFTVQQGDKAVILSFGRLKPEVYGPGLHITWPRPINEYKIVPAGRINTAEINSHWLLIHENERNTPLANLQRTGGLHPTRDGVLLTGDKGLVHVRWQVVYHIDNVLQYVKTIKDDDIKEAEGLIRTVLEDVAIRNAATRPAEDIVYRHPKEMQDDVRRALNERLADLHTGIVLDKVDIAQSTMPIPTLQQYQQVTRAQNDKQTRISAAEADANRILNQAAGAAHEKLITRLDEREKTLAANDTAKVTALNAEIERMLSEEVGGEAGAMIQRARGQYTSTIQRMGSDLEQYRGLLAEYERSPASLINRLWEQTRKQLLSGEGVTKIHVSGAQEIRLTIPSDPEQVRQDKMKAMQKSSGMPPR